MPPERTAERKPKRTQASSSSSTRPVTTSPEVKMETNNLNDPSIIRITTQLPNEIIERILSNFTTYDQGTLASCCAVSRTFNAVAHSMLWRWIRLSPPTQPKGNADKKIIPINVSRWTEEDGKRAQFLSIPYHHHTWCEFKHPRHLDLPNIGVLEVELGSVYSSDSTLHQYHHYIDPNNLCRLTKHLSPHSLIIRNATPAIGRESMRDIWIKTWRNVENLVCIFSYIRGDFHYWRGDQLQKMSRLSKVVWIFDPIIQASFYTARKTGSISYYRYTDCCLLTILLKQFPDVSITVVNVGNSDLYGSHGTISEEHTVDAETIFRSSVGNHSPLDQASSKHKLVSFITLDEFLEKKNWQDWFDVAEVEKWKEAVASIEKSENGLL